MIDTIGEKGAMLMFADKIKQYIMTTLCVTSEQGITDQQKLTDGKSGADVYRIRVNSSRTRYSGVYIIKLTRTDSFWYDTSNNEATANDNLRNNAKNFQNRLVKKISDKVIDKYHVMIFRQANNSVLSTVSLEKLIISDQHNIISNLSYELLSSWNQNCDCQNCSLDSLIVSLLSYRLDENGSFKKRILGFLEKIDAKSFLIDKVVLPNPFYYIKHVNEWAGKLQGFSSFWGNVHGDLHRKNVLCNKEHVSDNESDYFIIDYDTYSNNQGLLFDHAYLELSIYYETIFQDLDIKTLCGTLDKTVSCDIFKGIPNVDVINTPILSLRNAVSQGIVRWKNESYPHMCDEISIQYHIMRIIAGVNFFSKSKITDDGLLKKLLLYLGICFRRLFEIIDFEWSSEDMSKLLYAVSKNDYIDDLWDNCLKKVNKRIPVLITDDSYSQDEYSELLDLDRIDWSLIIDIGSHMTPWDITTSLFRKLSETKHSIRWNHFSS